MMDPLFLSLSFPYSLMLTSGTSCRQSWRRWQNEKPRRTPGFLTMRTSQLLPMIRQELVFQVAVFSCFVVFHLILNLGTHF